MATISARDGHPLYFEEQGTGDTLVLVHGFAAHGGFFAPPMAHLARHCRIIVPDLRGHRHSRRPGDQPTLERLAEDLGDLIAGVAGGAPVVIAGWSLGALVALEYLRRAGTARVRGLIVEDMSPRVLNTERWRLGMTGGFDAAMSEHSVALMRRDWRGFARAAAHNLFAAGLAVDPALQGWVQDEIEANDPPAMAHLWGSLAASGYETFIEGLDLPVLVLWGRHSRLYRPAVARYWLERLPDGRDCPFERSGHALHLEEPVRFCRCVRRFMKELAPR